MLALFVGESEFLGWIGLLKWTKQVMYENEKEKYFPGKAKSKKKGERKKTAVSSKRRNTCILQDEGDVRHT